MTALLIAIAWLLDRHVGTPRSWMIGFEDMAARVEAWLYQESRWRGALAVAGVLLAPVILVDEVALTLADMPGYWAEAWAVLVLYFCLDNRVTSAPRASEPAAACIEAVESGGLFGVLFWFLVAGAPGALLYRLARNLKEMWNRDSQRYRQFGWAAAELDDILGLVPAWLTAASFALLGATRPAWTCWRQQAGICADTNTGILLASAGGALGLRLRDEPPLGSGAAPVAEDVARAETLARRTLLLWLGLLAASGLVWWLLERHLPHHTQHWHNLIDTLREVLVD